MSKQQKCFLLNDFNMKKLILLITLLVCTIGSSQILEPIKWATSVEKISDTEYKLVTKATIESGWHLYSQNVPEFGPIPTSFSFNEKASDFQLLGKTIESEGIEDITKTTDFCKIMKLYGAKIAIDDFGSGFSNYEYIFDIPIDIIKIDGSLVKRIDDYRGYLVLESIMKLCKNLNIEVVAEFVENEIIFEKLKALGVDMYQGYYISTPKDFKELC